MYNFCYTAFLDNNINIESICRTNFHHTCNDNYKNYSYKVRTQEYGIGLYKDGDDTIAEIYYNTNELNGIAIAAIELSKLRDKYLHDLTYSWR